MSVQDDIQRTRRLRARRLALVPPPSPVEPDPVEILLEGLEGIQQTLANLAQAVLAQPAQVPPTVVVDVDPSPFVTALNKLKPGATPDEIGKAVASHLPPPVESLTKEELEELLKAVANNVSYPIAGGGGTVGFRQKAITDLAAAINAPVPLVTDAVKFTISADGDSTVHTTAADKRLVVKWLFMKTPLTNPGEMDITLKGGTSTIYRVSMAGGDTFSHVLAEPFTGLIGDDLTVTIGAVGANPVSYPNVLYVDTDIEET